MSDLHKFYMKRLNINFVLFGLFIKVMTPVLRLSSLIYVCDRREWNLYRFIGGSLRLFVRSKQIDVKLIPIQEFTFRDQLKRPIIKLWTWKTPTKGSNKHGPHKRYFYLCLKGRDNISHEENMIPRSGCSAGVVLCLFL